MAQSLSEQLAEVWDSEPTPVRDTGESQEPDDDEPLESEAGEEPERDDEPEPEEAEGEAGDGEQVIETGEWKGWTPAEVAEALGLEPSELFEHMIIPVDDGEPIPLSKLKDDRHEVARSKAELAQQQQMLAQQFQQLQQQQQQWLAARQEVSEAEREARDSIAGIQQRYNQLKQWEQEALSKDDTAALVRIERELREVGTAYAGAKQRLEQVSQADQQRRMQYATEDRRRHDEALMAAIPEWRDPSVAQQESEQINRMLIEHAGFSPQEIEGIYDYRARYLARWALKGLQAAAREQETRKVLKAAPKKLMRPGGGKGAAPNSAKLKATVGKAMRPDASWQERRAALRAMTRGRPA
jgi:hypothetical protein